MQKCIVAFTGIAWVLLVGVLFIMSACGEIAEPPEEPVYDRALIQNVAIWYDELPENGSAGFIDEDGEVYVTDFGGVSPENDQVIRVFYDPMGTATRLDDVPVYWEAVD